MTNTTQVTSAIPFQFNNTEVRVIKIDNQIWFVASDIAKILKYRDSEKMTRMLDDDEADTRIVGISSENGVVQNREVTIINESGFYHAVLKSRKPEAKPFRRWVTSEVLPAIRKTGKYEASNTKPTEATVTELQPIDVRACLLDKLSKPETILPNDIKDAIDRKAFALALEAHELLREHLRRRIQFNAWTPLYGLDKEKALACIDKGDLGYALAHHYYTQLNWVESTAKTFAVMANNLVKDMQNPQPPKRPARINHN